MANKQTARIDVFAYYMYSKYNRLLYILRELSLKKTTDKCDHVLCTLKVRHHGDVLCIILNFMLNNKLKVSIEYLFVYDKFGWFG